MLARSRAAIATARERVEKHDSLLPLRSFLLLLSRREMCVVEWLWRGARHPVIRRTAVMISWLGNGSIYLLLALLLMFARPAAGFALGLSALCILLAHLVYPWMKAACARERPCELHLDLEPLLCSLDRHSFPSGHAMTLTAALVPVLIAFPDLWAAALALWLAMAWSRIACAHHYPTDVLAGALLGLLAAAPAALFLATLS